NDYHHPGTMSNAQLFPLYCELWRLPAPGGCRRRSRRPGAPSSGPATRFSRPSTRSCSATPGSRWPTTRSWCGCPRRRATPCGCGVRLPEARGHPLRMSQLAEAAASSKSRISHAVARLEERGWIRRRDCPTDRRGQLAQLTDEGYAVLVAAAPGHVEQVRRTLFDPLTPEQVRQLHAIPRSVLARPRHPPPVEAGPPLPPPPPP